MGMYKVDTYLSISFEVQATSGFGITPSSLGSKSWVIAERGQSGFYLTLPLLLSGRFLTRTAYLLYLSHKGYFGVQAMASDCQKSKQKGEVTQVRLVNSYL